MAYATISKPGLHFNTVLYTGNGSSQTITGVGFQADFIWFKERSSAGEHKLNNSVLGTNYYLISNSTSGDDTTGSGIQSYNSDGYAVSNASNINDNTETYVTWNWLAGGSASSNTDGDITSSVSANTTAGFSIVSYTGNGSAGATVGHGLGSAPAVMIFKIRNTADNWRVYHQGIDATAPEDYHAQLNSTGARIDNAGFFNDTAPTSSVFTLGSDSGINGSSNTFIAYCFAEKKGYSKFGTYTGNGNVDGPFVYTGFKPAWVMTKCASTSSTYTVWGMWDNKRNPFNASSNVLATDLNEAENGSTIGTTQPMDLLSNGFKARANSSIHNLSGETHLYMAFAESPFVTSTGIPNNAR